MFGMLRDLIAIDSPSGFTGNACSFVSNTLRGFGFQPTNTRKGAVRCTLGTGEPTLAFAAHVDTLGAMVSSVNPDGTLSFSIVGGPLLHTFESAFVRVYTSEGLVYHGTLWLNNPSAHANNKSSTTERNNKTMHVRLDEDVQNADHVRDLGISVGDFICFDPRYTHLPSGYIKSHFLDNKAGCVVLMEMAKIFANEGLDYPVEIFFSNYEEVGHGGASGYSSTVQDLIVIDMGVVGDGIGGKETLCSICAKDSMSPYDYELRTRLTRVARENSIPHSVDVYPFYSSDGSAAWKAGFDARVALIGPGVYGSHGMERTHEKGLSATVDLCIAFIKEYFA